MCLFKNFPFISLLFEIIETIAFKIPIFEFKCFKAPQLYYVPYPLDKTPTKLMMSRKHLGNTWELVEKMSAYLSHLSRTFDMHSLWTLVSVLLQRYP